MANFFDILVEVLKQDTRFFTDDATLLRNKVYEFALNMDSGLIELLLSNDDTKKRFFVEVNGTYVFDKVGFGWVVNNRQFLPDSYTRFKNRIGLTDSQGDLISQSNEVVLTFPYKDCVLEGGQTKDDQKRDEVFYNETLAPDEVDRLLYPKVLVNAKRYIVDGVEEGVTFRDGDNLIVKGNNLIAIASLLRRYEGKVQLVNIDPPYNTGNDSFGYNDKFNHSTWLVFMKNRLEIAKRLLKPQGFLCCQVNESESYYLKVLLDEIFGRDNYLTTLFVKVRYAEKTLKQDMDFHKEVEQVLVYRATAAAKPNFDMVETGIDKYIYYVREKGDYISITLGGKRVDIFDKRSYEIVQGEPSTNGLKEIWASGTILDGNSSGRFFRDFLTGRSAEDGLGVLYKVYGVGDDQFDYRYFTGPQRATATKGKYYQGVPNDQLSGTSKGTVPINSFYDLSGSFGNCRHEGGVEFRSGKKPEALYKTILKHFSNEKDTVIDFFLGSGSTAAVAHKMRRYFLGVEQLDYGNNDSVIRMQNVINGDKTGISTEVDWQGGGSFVCCELAKCNQHYLDEVVETKTDAELTELLDRILKTGFISSKINPADIVASATDFEALSLEDKKLFILELLDKNMLYINLCDLDDEEYTISETDKAFTRSFYGLEDK